MFLCCDEVDGGDDEDLCQLVDGEDYGSEEEIQRYADVAQKRRQRIDGYHGRLSVGEVHKVDVDEGVIRREVTIVLVRCADAGDGDE